MQYSLTPKQSELLAYIRAYIAQNNGVAPSFDEMRDAMGIAAKSGIHRMIDGLQARGYVSRMKGQARSLVLVDGMEAKK
jgi:repressor LexA